MSESPKARTESYLNELEKLVETKALLCPTLDQRIWVTSTLQQGLSRSNLSALINLKGLGHGLQKAM